MMEHNFNILNVYYSSKRLGDTENVVPWKPKGLSTEKFIAPTTTDNSISPSIKWYSDSHFCLIFKESCLKRKKNFTPPIGIIFFIVYELDTWS